MLFGAQNRTAPAVPYILNHQIMNSMRFHNRSLDFLDQDDCGRWFSDELLVVPGEPAAGVVVESESPGDDIDEGFSSCSEVIVSINQS